MSMLPEEVRKAWDNRNEVAVFSTVREDGTPNCIYVTCVGMFDDKLVVADNYFEKTRANILAGSKGVILFMTKEGTPYQVKGSLEYHQSGALFDDMKKWNPQKHPGLAAVALCPKMIYSGARKVL